MTNTSKAVLVTGCSSGIGRATAEHLAGKGWTVYATARRPESIADLEARAAARSRSTSTDEASMAGRGRRGRGGRGRRRRARSTTPATASRAPSRRSRSTSFARQFETNVFGLVRMCQLVLPGMRRQGWGKIVNVSSMGGQLRSRAAASTTGPSTRSRRSPTRCVSRSRASGSTFDHRAGPHHAPSFGDAAAHGVGAGSAPDGPYAEFNAAVARPRGTPTRTAAGQARRRARDGRPSDREGDLPPAPQDPLQGHALGPHGAGAPAACFPTAAGTPSCAPSSRRRGRASAATRRGGTAARTPPRRWR